MNKLKKNLFSDGPSNRYTEIWHSTACDDMCELDLDSLAPYIPTHEEDFHLTPVLNGEGNDSGFYRHPSSVSETWLTLEQKMATDSEAEVCFPGYSLISPSQWHDSARMINKKHQERFMNQNKTSHWKDVSRHLPEHFDEGTVWTSGQSHTESIHLAYKYAKLSWCPPGSSSQHSNQTTVEETPSALGNLPELSRWECEVNAPLGPTSILLQGTELTNVLDQVASGVDWF